MKNEIKEFQLHPLTNPRFIHPSLVTYSQNGTLKSWEIVKAHDSVAILIYHREMDYFVLVKQFRPAVYLADGIGMTVELCAGLVDKEMSLEQIACEEIEEECGYAVPLESIERITSFYTSVGFAGGKQTLYYTEVNEEMRCSDGGGLDGELIEVLTLPTAQIDSFIYDESIAKTPGLLFAFEWWKKRFL